MEFGVMLFFLTVIILQIMAILKLLSKCSMAPSGAIVVGGMAVFFLPLLGSIVVLCWDPNMKPKNFERYEQKNNERIDRYKERLNDRDREIAELREEVTELNKKLHGVEDVSDT